MAKVKPRRRFGQIQRLPSGRYRARYSDPEGRLTTNGEPLRHSATHTFDTIEDAEAWLTDERRLVSAGEWSPPADRIAARLAKADAVTFGPYAESWLRVRDLKPRTTALYRSLLDRLVLPTFAGAPLDAITSSDVRDWYSGLGSKTPTQRSHAYALLRTILAQAERDELISRNPASIRGASSSRRVHPVRPLTLQELDDLVAAMPKDRRVMTLLAAWCALRFGELTELRRKDIDLKAGVIRVRRAVVRVDGETIVGTPKSGAGVRDVAIPPHILTAVRQHLADHMGGREALLFPSADGGHLAPSTLYGRRPSTTRTGHGFYAAREAIGRPDLRWHDLRHTGAVLAAYTGATLAELQARMGHSTVNAAMRYQTAAADRDKAIANALSRLVEQGK